MKKQKNILSILILLEMLALIAVLGAGAARGGLTFNRENAVVSSVTESSGSEEAVEDALLHVLQDSDLTAVKTE